MNGTWTEIPALASSLIGLLPLVVIAGLILPVVLKVLMIIFNDEDKPAEKSRDSEPNKKKQTTLSIFGIPLRRK